MMLRPGMTFTIEPMINVANGMLNAKDGWTAVTKTNLYQHI